MGDENKIKTKARLKVAAEAFGGFATLLATVLFFFADKVFDASGNIYKFAIILTLIGYTIIFIAALIIFTIFKLSSTKKEIYSQCVQDLSDSTSSIKRSAESVIKANQMIDKSLAMLSQNIDKERSILTDMSIGRYVLDGNEVINLEESVGNEQGRGHCKIYVQSQLFVLEKGPLERVILWNLRKGVKYIYIIPKKESYVNGYYEMLQDWYRLFSSFLNSKEEFELTEKDLNDDQRYREHWHSDYSKLYQDAKQIWNNTSLATEESSKKIAELKHRCEELFKKLIETHVDDESEFYITVVAYEVKRNKWKAIIKLPTENIDNEYYAFQIPSKNSRELDNFIHSFQDRFKSIKYVHDDFKTMGGKLDVDFSKIFS